MDTALAYYVVLCLLCCTAYVSNNNIYEHLISVIYVAGIDILTSLFLDPGKLPVSPYKYIDS